MEQEVKMRVVQMSKSRMKPASILNTLKIEFPGVGVRQLVDWIDDLIESERHITL